MTMSTARVMMEVAPLPTLAGLTRTILAVGKEKMTESLTQSEEDVPEIENVDNFENCTRELAMSRRQRSGSHCAASCMEVANIFSKF